MVVEREQCAVARNQQPSSSDSLMSTVLVDFPSFLVFNQWCIKVKVYLLAGLIKVDCDYKVTFIFRKYGQPKHVILMKRWAN